MPKYHRSFGIILATILMLVTALLGVIPAGAAATSDDPMSQCNAPADSSTPGVGDFTAPAPMKLDASGTELDGFCIPEADFEGSFRHPDYGWGSYYLDGKALEMGFHELTDGATSVTITTSFDSGSYLFDFSADEVGEEAENQYWVELGDTCRRQVQGTTRYREATAYVKNVDDKTDFSFNVWPDVEDVEGVVNVVDTEAAYDIPDGEIGFMRIMKSDGVDGVLGLPPGTYRVKFWLSHTDQPWNGDIVKRMKLTVPRCGKDSTADPGSKQARGDLKRFDCRVKVVANTRGFTLAPKVRYKLVRKPFGKRARQGSFAVPAGQKRSFVVKRLGHARVTLTLKVKRPTGKWVKLDRVTRPRCR